MTLKNFSQSGLHVRPVMYWPPTFMMPHYWKESARKFEWVSPATPLAQRPALELQISLDVCLGEVLEAACDAWEIFDGPDMLNYGTTRMDEFHRFGFVRIPEDIDGIHEHIGYSWPSQLPVARENGSVEYVPGLKVTYRELLVSSKLGLIIGDVTRPYVFPKSPQGVPAPLGEVINIGVDVVRIAYANVRNCGHDVTRMVNEYRDDAIKVDAAAMAVYGHVEVAGRIRAWWRNRKSK